MVIKFSTFGQVTDTILKEGFNTIPSLSLPTGWITTAGSSNYTWGILNWNGAAANFYSHSGTSCAFSSSDGFIPDAYLITPNLTISDTSYHLSFWISAGDANYYSEHYSVLVSETGTNFADFNPIYSETLTSADPDGSISYKKKTFSLAAYNGKNIYVAFRHSDCNNQYMLRLDDVLVSGTKKDHTGISVLNSQELINVYPNPTSTSINITNVNNPYVDIFDNSGKLVLNSTNNFINLESLNDGIYTVKVKTENSIIIKKISVIKNL